MRKKIICALGICAALFTATFCGLKYTSSPVIAYAETSEVVETGKVILPEKITGGKIIADKLEGEVGEVVTLTVEKDVFYKLSGITVNGITLQANAEGKYEFTLIAGDNIVTVTFAIDNELISKAVEIVNQAKAGDWASIFSFQNIMLLINWILDAGIGVALVKIISKYKKLKVTFASNAADYAASLKEEVEKIIPETTAKILNDLVKDVLTPVLDKLTAVEESNKIFARCMALAQENTPESRLAIVELLSGIKTGDVNIAAEVKAFLAEELKSIEETYNKRLEVLEEAKAANEAVKVELGIVEEKKEKEEKIEVKNYDGTEI